MSTDELFQEILDFATDQDEELTQDLWDTIVEEIIDGHKELGDFKDSEDVEIVKQDLKERGAAFLAARLQ